MSETQIMATDPLDAFMEAAASTLQLPLDLDWRPAVKTNLDVTLKHAAAVAEFLLPDDAEPAPVFKA
jgi:1-carboxybiuret hydrolase subunit AtzG-like